jgi:hypothetical protein
MFMFLHPVGSMGHIMCSSVSGVRNFDARFLMLGWDDYGFHIKHVWTHYAKLVFFHPVGSTGHIVQFGASRAQNVNALFFVLG